MDVNLLEEHNYCKCKEIEYEFTNSILDNGIVAQDPQTLLELFEKFQSNSNDILLKKLQCKPKKKKRYNRKNNVTKSSNLLTSRRLLIKNNKEKISKPSLVKLKINHNAPRKCNHQRRLSSASLIKTEDLQRVSNNNFKDYKNALTNPNIASFNDNFSTLMSTSNNKVQNSNENKLCVNNINSKNTNSSKMLLNQLLCLNNIRPDEINKNIIPANISDNNVSISSISNNIPNIPLEEYQQNYDEFDLKYRIRSPLQKKTAINNARNLSQGKGGHRRRRVMRGETNFFNKIPSYYTMFSRPPRGITKAASHTNIDWGQFTDNIYYEDGDNIGRGNTIPNMIDKIPNYHSCFTNSMKYSFTDSMPISPLLHNSDNDIQTQFKRTNCRNLNEELSHNNNNNIKNYTNDKPNEENDLFCDQHSRYIHTLSNEYDHQKTSTKNIINQYNSYDINSKIEEQEMKTELMSTNYNDKSLTLGDSLIQTNEIICDSNNNGVENNKILCTSNDNIISNSNDDNNFDKIFRNIHLKGNIDLKGLEMLCDVALNDDAITNNSDDQHNNDRKNELRELEDNKLFVERRIIYIGRIENELSKDQLRNIFQQFGSILDCSVHFREYGENYGFVSFENSHSASLAVQESSKIDLLKNYDICFGGRRKFCMHEYFDLDGRQQLIEDLVPASSRRRPLQSFDELLREASATIRAKC